LPSRSLAQCASAAGDGSDGAHQFVRRAALCDVAAGASLERFQRERGARMHGEHQQARGAIPLPDMPDRFQPAGAGQRQIHDHHVRALCLIGAIGRSGILGLGADAKTDLPLQ
jgi:hypothetical protein